jgi:hypothetical protein
VVAIAAKNARMAWAVLTKGESFKLPACGGAAMRSLPAAPAYTFMPATAPP